MANQELNMGYPFEGMGTHVYGERFVGRKSEVKKLQKFCTSHNYSIQGLPKIGKTSLAYQSVIFEKDRVVSKSPLCTIFYDVAANHDSVEFFRNLIALVAEKVLSITPSEQHFLILDQLLLLDKENYKNGTTIEGFFHNGLASLNVSVVIIFDEFDKVRTMFTGTDFSILRSIISAKNLHGIFVSKRSIEIIEGWLNKADGGPSNFYQCFQNNTIHLKPFSKTPKQDELEEYWNRLIPYFKAVGLDLSEEYKMKALSYSGKLPHLLDLFNSKYYEEFVTSGEPPSEVNLRTAMQSAFDATIVILKEQELLYPAIQAIIGPVYDLDQKRLDLLLSYGFLREVTPNEKRKLIGINAGFVDLKIVDCKESEIAYIAPSDYFTLLFKKEFTTKVDFWKEWESTFVSIRKIASMFLIDNWGDNWDEAPDVDPVVSFLKESLDKDYRSGISPSPLIEYLNESIWLSMLQRNWATFQSIFVNINIIDKFEYLMKIRNHHAHINYKFLSQENRDLANSYLAQVSECINTWMKQGDLPKLTVKTIEGIVERDKEAFHVEGFLLKKYDGELLEGKRIRVEDIEKNKNPKFCAKYPYIIKKYKRL